MTAGVKHMARHKPATTGTAIAAQPRNSQLRERFPTRPAQPWWPCIGAGEEETLRRLTSPPFLPQVTPRPPSARSGWPRAS